MDTHNHFHPPSKQKKTPPYTREHFIFHNANPPSPPGLFYLCVGEGRQNALNRFHFKSNARKPQPQKTATFCLFDVIPKSKSLKEDYKKNFSILIPFTIEEAQQTWRVNYNEVIAVEITLDMCSCSIYAFFFQRKNN